MSNIVFVESRSKFNAFEHYVFPLLGPLYLGTILKQRGHRVRVYSELFKPVYDEKRDAVLPEVLDADIVAISTMTASALRAYRTATAIRRERPDIKILMGGVHPTAMPEEALEYADCVAVGEGESLVPDIFEEVPDRRIVYGQRVKDMNTLPIPDLTLLQGVRLPLKWAPIATSRGCPHECTFCFVPDMYGNRFRFRDVDLVMEEINLRYREGHRKFFFYDDYFTAKRGRIVELLEKIIRSGMKGLKWSAQTRADIAKDEQILGLLKRSGCNSLCLGLESVNPKTLEAYKKRQTLEEIIECVNKLRKVKVWVHGMFVLGADEDDLSTIDMSVKFCKKLKLDSAQFSIVFPIPGTGLFRWLDSQKRIFTKDWSLYDGLHVVFQTSKMTPLELQQNVLKAWRRFYNVTNSSWGILGYIYCRYILSRWKRLNQDFMRMLRSIEELARQARALPQTS